MQQKRRRKLLTIFLIILGVYIGLNAAVAYSFLHPPRKVASPIAGTQEFMYNGPGGPTPLDVSDNFHEAKLVFVCAHGYLGNRNTFDGVAAELMKEGYGVLIPAMPGQDASPAGAVSFGPEEAKAIHRCVEYVRIQNPTAHIILLGVSLGGAACWMASPEDSKHIDAVVTEGAFAHLNLAVSAALDRKVPYGSILLRPSVWIAELLSGLRVSKINPVKEAAMWKGPGLVIQAEDDRLISGVQAKELSQAAKVPEWVVPGARHARCFESDPTGYMQRLDELAEKSLKNL